jgi:hypothetical protein
LSKERAGESDDFLATAATAIDRAEKKKTALVPAQPIQVSGDDWDPVLPDWYYHSLPNLATFHLLNVGTTIIRVTN